VTQNAFADKATNQWQRLAHTSSSLKRQTTWRYTMAIALGILTACFRTAPTSILPTPSAM